MDKPVAIQPLKEYYTVFTIGVIAWIVYMGTILLRFPLDFRNIFSDVLCIIINGITVFGLWLYIRWIPKSNTRKSIIFILFALAQGLMFLGDVIWFVYDIIFRLPPLSSNIIEYLYLLYYPILFLAVLLIPQNKKGLLHSLKNWLESCIIILGAFIGYFIYLITPILENRYNLNINDQVLVITYSVFDFLLIAIILMMRDKQDSYISNQASVALVFSAFILIFSDTFLILSSMTGKDTYGSWSDAEWMLSYLFMGLVPLLQIDLGFSSIIYKKVNYILKQIDCAINDFFPYLPYVMLVVAYVYLVLKYQTLENYRFSQIAIGVGVIIGLAIIRLVIEYIDNTQLNQKLQKAYKSLKTQQIELSQTNIELQQEICERRQMEGRLAYDALHDWLTGLPNRVLFLDRLGQALEYSQRHSDFHFSVLFLDLDQFKVINDSMGHNAGDLMLIAVGKRLTTCIRASDTVARLGGDEFVFLLENIQDESSLQPVTNRIMEELVIPYKLQDKTAFITASIGVVLNITGYSSTDDVLRDADIAMYRAKEMGKACTAIFETSMRSRAISRLEMENDLHKALENEEFVLYYQPIIGLGRNNLVGFEALIRWKHPDRGIILPLDFIGIAEESGLILPIGKWVLQKACWQSKNWQDRIPSGQKLFVNVNISGKQFAQPEFVEQIEQVLIETGLSPTNLKLEITESVLINNYATANAIFHKLANLGIQFEIDDFGTGYSSIGYLRHFPIHTIKIDKTFIRDMNAGTRGIDLIQTMISMANNLGMETIAEGVESEDQLQKLLEMKCNYGQGYYLSLPLESDEAERFIQETTDRANLLESSKQINACTNISEKDCLKLMPQP
jgi:diguanylate cyclase (GGDEF)-like protein